MSRKKHLKIVPYIFKYRRKLNYFNFFLIIQNKF